MNNQKATAAVRRRMVLTLPLLGVAAQCLGSTAHAAKESAKLPLAKRSVALMGTRVDMAIPADTSAQLPALFSAMDAAVLHMQRLEQMMSRYYAGSDVSRLAASAGIRPVRVTPQVFEVLVHAQRLHAQSDGAFDITIGAVKGWNFEAGREQMPSDAELRRALALVNMRQLVLDADAGTAFLQRRGMALDLGGIAKLPILQAGLDHLRKAGVRDALINGGGDVLITGSNHDQPWRVGVRDPNAPQQLLGVLALQGAGIVASSGDYERAFTRNGQRLHHVLNPLTGQPTQGVHGVALRAERVDQVNGWGCALMVQGRAALDAFCAKHPAIDLLAGFSDGAHWQSRGMRERLVRTPAFVG